MYSYNSETSTYTADNTSKDIEEAYTDLKCRQASDPNIKLSMSIMENGKEILHTSDTSEMYKAFMEMSPSTFDENINAVFGTSALIISDSSKSPLPKLSTAFSGVSTVSTIIAIGKDLNDCIKNPNPDTGSDLLFSGIGIIPGWGGYASVALSFGKQGLIKAATEMAKASRGFEDAYINYVSVNAYGFKLR